MEISPELVAACRRGDAQAFEALLRLTQGQLFTLAYRIVGNHEDAADVVQEAYLKAWRGMQRFRGDSEITTWLYRITSNAAIELLRRRGRFAEPMEPDKLNEYAAPSDPEPPAVESSDVEAALARLSAPDRTALVLRELYGLSMEEIAKQMGTTVGATKVRLHRARIRLANELERSGVVVPLHREKKRSS